MTQSGDTAWKVEAVRSGKELRRLRERAGLTQRQLAAVVRMNHSYLHKLEVGQGMREGTRYWLPLAMQAAIEARIAWEASLRITALELQERVEDRVARHVGKKMGFATPTTAIALAFMLALVAVSPAFAQTAAGGNAEAAATNFTTLMTNIARASSAGFFFGGLVMIAVGTFAGSTRLAMTGKGAAVFGVVLFLAQRLYTFATGTAQGILG